MIPWFQRLSARRRKFTAGVALLATVTAAGVASAVIVARSGSPGSFPPQDRPGPVFQVPGYGGSTRALSVLARRIRAAGREAIALRLPGNGTGSLTDDARVLDSAVAAALRSGAPSVDVIGYSAGGVAVLLWARADGGDRKARRVITLGSPFRGASIAAAAEGFAPGACPPACQQLIPGSSLLRGLAAGVPPRLPWLSLWTTTDQTVRPPDSARLAGAIDVPLQSLCPGQRISHAELPVSPVVTAIVLRAIGPGPMRPPRPAVCRG